MTSDENRKPREAGYRRRTTDASWVAIIIFATVVFFAVNGHESDASGRGVSTTEPTFSSTAILGGIDRQNSSPAFRSAEASAFMGGVKLDFRGAIMDGDEARIEVSAIMGGVDIRIPRTWTVVNRVTPVLGGVEDHTHSTGGNKRLVIEGTVLMGGLDIKN
jgi:predicted membrane protein